MITDHNDDDTRASGAAISEHSEPGSPFNNIDPGKYIDTQPNMPDDFLPLRFGFDTLHLSYRGEMTQDARERLEKLKEMAQNPDKAHLAQVHAAGHVFMVSDKGRGRYRYLLLGACFEIQLCDTPSPSIPVAFVKVLSQTLATLDPVAVEEQVRAILSLLCLLDARETVSRADLYLDFCCRDEDLTSLQAAQFVTRAEVIRPYYTDQRLTGWDIGLGSHLSARIYNKTFQIKKSKQEYLKYLWKDAGWNGEETIWRVEFQLRRSVLAMFDVVTVEDLVRMRSQLWSYLTKEWLRVAIPSPSDSNRSRWQTHPMWVGVWDGACGSVGMPMRKVICRDNAPELEQIMQALCGPLSSLLAVQNITDIKQAMKWLALHLLDLLKGNFSSKGQRLDIYLTDQVKKKIRIFNLRLNDEKLGNPGNFYK